MTSKGARLLHVTMGHPTCMGGRRPSLEDHQIAVEDDVADTSLYD